MADTPPRSGRGIKIALVISLALNLLILGVFAGEFLRGGPGRDLGFGPFAAAFTDADRKALRREFRQRMPDLRASRVAQREAMAGVAAALRAEPFDPEELRAAVAATAARLGDRVQIAQELLVGHLSAMSPEDRAAFAGRLEAAAARGPGPRP
jgi:uncharacterized membrane protein